MRSRASSLAPAPSPSSGEASAGPSATGVPPPPSIASRFSHWIQQGASTSERLFEKSIRNLMDGDGARGEEGEIWLLGVSHSGHDSSTSEEVPANAVSKSRNKKRKQHRSSPAPSTTRSVDSTTSTTPATIAGWPASFYRDFYSRISLTYRFNFTPIPCSAARSSSTTGVSGVLNSLSLSMGRGMRAVGNSSNVAGDSVGSGSDGSERGLTSDTGWGCMLRTGQSLLANALVGAHLGRDWRRTLPSSTDDQQSFALYARILSLFFDTPSPLCPFSVHAFALHGKSLGKEVGEWFGPSTAAGAIKALVNGWDGAGMEVVEGSDGTIYRDEVAATSCGKAGEDWSRPVLVLIGLRLGIDGVTPVYYDSIKAIFSLPQSVGIAGGRPSSSYYFVGAQANDLVYIDPHHPKPFVEMVVPPGDLWDAARTLSLGSPSFSSDQPSKPPDEELSDSFVTVQPPRNSFSIRRPSATSIPPPTNRSHSSPPTTLRDTPALPTRLANFFATAYSDPVKDTEIRSYHCDKVRKMPLSSLDPSMLVGFLIKDEADWNDFHHLVDEVRLFRTTLL